MWRVAPMQHAAHVARRSPAPAIDPRKALRDAVDYSDYWQDFINFTLNIIKPSRFIFTHMRKARPNN
ncbi:hypothetical protein [Xylophilus sp. GOD-11R]|uniref:hypothetical protein n=1 Tax=Xylophilus sp. GOD-11R TaxID=3089814 RepID=UPI00298C5A49|nr:hypothetical protein [Xylophilus sp. GOD-11R]WPB56668.1 hypothetical protein R9X41_21405 [Xylophilus sp. GOD-11R]